LAGFRAGSGFRGERRNERKPGDQLKSPCRCGERIGGDGEGEVGDGSQTTDWRAVIPSGETPRFFRENRGKKKGKCDHPFGKHGVISLPTRGWNGGLHLSGKKTSEYSSEYPAPPKLERRYRNRGKRWAYILSLQDVYWVGKNC